MNRYVWSLDNKVISETDKILIKKGENVRIVLYNGSMMRHPMHLHGHDFRILNEHGDYSPLKNVIDIMPMETDTHRISGKCRWRLVFSLSYFISHDGGMGRIFSYENSAPNPLIHDPKMATKC